MDELKRFLISLGIDDIDIKCEKLYKYMEALLEWNTKVNLTAITNEAEFVQKHYIDSLLCAASSEFQTSNQIIDIGTGGGFPGIPLAICYPGKRFLLMDSLAKRMKIVSELCEELDITNVSVMHGRAEDLGRKDDLREKFDLCVSRAVANMSTLSEYCLPFVKKEGNFIAYKGSDCEDEIASAKRAVSILGGEIVRIDNVDSVQTLAYESDIKHKLVFVKKVKSTPKGYPRKAGTPSKKPL